MLACAMCLSQQWTTRFSCWTKDPPAGCLSDPCIALHGSQAASVGGAALTKGCCAGPSRFLWVGNLLTRVNRAILKVVFEPYGPLDDVITFMGRMYAFVSFHRTEDAINAVLALQNRPVGHHCCLSWQSKPFAVATGSPSATLQCRYDLMAAASCEATAGLEHGRPDLQPCRIAKRAAAA